MAQNLVKAPGNLTTIKARNDGTFAAVKIMEIIDGRRDVKLHGSRDMPVWGGSLGATARGAGTESEKMMVKGQIQAIVDYLQSIQH